MTAGRSSKSRSCRARAPAAGRVSSVGGRRSGLVSVVMATLCDARLGPNSGPDLGPPKSGAESSSGSAEFAAGVDDDCPRRAFAAPVVGTTGGSGDTLTYRGSGCTDYAVSAHANSAVPGGGGADGALRPERTTLWPSASGSWRSAADRWSKVWSQFLGTLGRGHPSLLPCGGGIAIWISSVAFWPRRAQSSK